MSAWIMPFAWGNKNLRILQKGANDDQYRLLLEAGVFKFQIAGVGLAAAPLPPINAWSHVVGTYDGIAVRIYINGVEAGSTPATQQMPVTFDSLVIGSKTIGAPAVDRFSGRIDEVRIYGRALSAVEVAQLAAN